MLLPVLLSNWLSYILHRCLLNIHNRQISLFFLALFLTSDSVGPVYLPSLAALVVAGRLSPGALEAELVLQGEMSLW